MSLGFVMLVHTALDRAAQTARHWAASGCPVVIHADRATSQDAYRGLVTALSDLENVRFTEPRHRCEWGTFGIVGATLAATELMLKANPELDHVYLASGSCLPLRPVPELAQYLADRQGTDFIESVTIEDVTWSNGGFDKERFTFRFPVSYRRNRWIFDRYVKWQRRIGVERPLPEGLVPHLGSQWWCLSTPTLRAILTDPRRAEMERYFRKVWIPDESFFQSLVRLHGTRIESRSLTLSKFDFEGRPHVFYDDHLQLLRRSDCFVARKIWPKADRLYASFLSNDPSVTKNAEPNPGKIDRLFTKSVEQRLRGRAGLTMAGRFPRRASYAAITCAPYSVFQGFDDLFQDFPDWLGRGTGLRVHGHLFAHDRVHFAGGEPVYNGALSDSAALRDANPRAFLQSLTWATRGERQCLMFSPRDVQPINRVFAEDANAQVSVISGAWAIPLYRSGRDAAEARKIAARLQRTEAAQLSVLRRSWVRARVRIWSLAEFLESPMEHLQPILDEVSPRSSRHLTEAPNMVDLTDFGRFLQDLRNDGMNLHLAGDFPSGTAPPVRPKGARPYLVK